MNNRDLPPEPNNENEPEQEPESLPRFSGTPPQSSPMQKLPRFSAWGVFGLSIISLGLYYTYWLFTRTQIINQIQDQKIPMGLAHTVIGLLMVNLIFSLMSGANPDNEDYRQLASISGLCFNLGNLFWVFIIRQRIHRMTKAGEQSLFWLNGIFTFLFQVLYLQYKINEYIDDHTSESSLAV